MTTIETAPTAIHRGESELPFVDIGDGATLQLLQVDLANGVWVIRSHFPAGLPGADAQAHRPRVRLHPAGSWHYLESPESVNRGRLVPLRAGRVDPHPASCPTTNDEVTDVWFTIHGANLNLDADGNVEMVIDAHGMLPFYRILCAEQFGMDDPPVVVVQ